ncbi:ABC-type multidrug transport system ATPase subunit [Pseudonocardia autotrophica]|uniref:Putative ABC transporter ATP-binding protein YxlF n=1 Tax=Pseudonocardia autotrophica TaxID=2074 RepID=A0A1Y2MSE9_PSEAH|nr:putative ABC transporter ATP-binding protein YxlF [Pseudonocardia autotrophica]TDN75586.1 ABC-type multidrug transport system ATPase subunit [Pseudonocardia autotrophica]
MRLVGIHHTHASGIVALRGIDLVVDPAAPTVLRGPGGAGKTTLLRVAAGVVVPTAGEIEDRPAVVGYLPDRFPARMKLPPRRWLDHMSRIRGLDPDDTGDRADELLEEFGYGGADDEPMSELSRSDAQKIGLVQALACDPDVLVLDEPWSGLDDDAADVLTRLLADRSGGLLLTDRTGTAAGFTGARLHRLRHGRLAAASDPDSVPLRTAPPPGSVMRLDLACAGDPRPVLEGLPPARVEAAAPGRLTVRVPAPESDAWLMAALAAGCAVRSVRPVRQEGDGTSAAPDARPPAGPPDTSAGRRRGRVEPQW